MKKPLTITILIFVSLSCFFTCGSPSQGAIPNIKNSNTEQAAVDSVIRMYGAKRYRWQTFKEGNSENPEYIFELEIEGCLLLKDHPLDTGQVVSGIAYNLYAELDDSKKKYDFFRIKLSNQEGTDQYDFTQDRLKEVERYHPLLLQTLAQVDANQYQEIYTQVEQHDTNLVLLSVKDIQEICHRVDSLAGDFKKASFFAFMYVPYPQKQTRFLALIATVEGSKTQIFFTLMLNPVTGKIVSIQCS
jgi:hypothetical protein